MLGLPFERERPAYAPIDEEHPLYPEFSYALSKLISEELARQFNRWTGIPYVGLALLERDGAARLRALPGLLGRSAAAPLEPLGLCRRARRRAGLPAGARVRACRGRRVHRGRRRHGDEPLERRADGRGLPGRRGPRRAGRVRDAALRSARRAGCSATSPRSPGASSCRSARGPPRMFALQTSVRKRANAVQSLV